MVRNNIAALRRAANLSQTGLAERIGTTLNMMGKLERGDRELNSTWINKIAVALGVEPHRVIGGEAADLPVVRDASAGETVDIIRLDLSLPMGPGATVDDYVEEEPLAFDLGYIRTFTQTPPTRLRLARGVGDSMFPTLMSSDLVWIDSTRTRLNQQDRIWAVSINGAAAIKRLRALKEGRVLVVSDNPTVENYEVGEEELLIGGRVIRFARDV